MQKCLCTKRTNEIAYDSSYDFMGELLKFKLAAYLVAFTEIGRLEATEIATIIRNEARGAGFQNEKIIESIGIHK